MGQKLCFICSEPRGENTHVCDECKDKYKWNSDEFWIGRDNIFISVDDDKLRKIHYVRMASENKNNDNAALLFPHFLKYVLYKDFRAIGYGIWSREAYKYPYISDVFVLPEYRKQGFGLHIVSN
jgi:GNAT superfamily N-acetyltransferase